MDEWPYSLVCKEWGLSLIHPSLSVSNASVMSLSVMSPIIESCLILVRHTWMSHVSNKWVMSFTNEWCRWGMSLIHQSVSNQRTSDEDKIWVRISYMMHLMNARASCLMHVRHQHPHHTHMNKWGSFSSQLMKTSLVFWDMSLILIRRTFDFVCLSDVPCLFLLHTAVSCILLYTYS